jgi:hypothetical protein
VLNSPAQLELLDSAGTVRLSATTATEPIPLSASTAMPTPDTNPTASEQLAVVSVLWPTDANAALEAGSDSGQCPTADFAPSTARISFAATSLTVSNLSNSYPLRFAICGSRIRMDIAPLGGE